MEAFNSFVKWKQTRSGLLITGAIELGLAYVFGSWALDSGSGWHYLLAVIFLSGAAISLVKAIRPHDSKD